jgi:hypothetical protein
MLDTSSMARQLVGESAEPIDVAARPASATSTEHMRSETWQVWPSVAFAVGA